MYWSSTDGTSSDSQRHTITRVARLPQNQVGHQPHTSFQQNYYNVHPCQPKKNITLIQPYAAASTCDDDLVEEFDEQLESAIIEIARKDLHIIQGDLEC